MTNVVQAQTVYLEGTRPTLITGLEINGIIYDVTVTYGQTIDGSTLSTGLPTSDALAAINAIATVLNAQVSSIPASTMNNTSVCIVTADNGANVSGICVNALGTVPPWMVFDFLAGRMDFPSSRPGNGIANFTLAVPVPTMSQWGLLIFGLLIMNLSVFFVQRRELI